MGYPYISLDLPNETRLLIVHPGDFEDDLRCSLTHLVFTAPDVPYTALSYCWNSALKSNPPENEFPPTAAIWAGDSKEPADDEISMFLGRMLQTHIDRTESLYYTLGWPLPLAKLDCDGVEVPVGGELHACLRRLRKPDEELRIWVDALCINQADVAEKSEHVKLMGEIYSNAEAVHVWLGESIGDENTLFEGLETIGHVFEELADLLQIGRPAVPEIQRRFINDERIGHLDFGALRALLSRSWFERIWVIQEAAKGKRIIPHIGRSEFDWTFFTAIVKTMRQCAVDVMVRPAAGPKAVCMMDSFASTSNGTASQRMDLLTALEETRAFKSTLPCDKIFAILGLVDGGADILVDYSRHSAAIFTDYTTKCLLEDDSLSILYHCVYSTHPDILGLPSWVADWTRPGVVEPLYIRGLDANAAGSTTPSIAIDSDGKTLRAKGFKVDTVAAIETKKVNPAEAGVPFEDANPHRPGHDTAQHMEMMHEMNNIWIQNAFDIASYARDDPSENQLWRAFMCNRKRNNEMPGIETARGFYLFANAILSDRTPAGEVKEQARQAQLAGMDQAAVQEAARRDQRVVDDFVGGFSKWTNNRRFFKTETGRFGWAVDGIEAGDSVVVLHGGRYPFLMRPCEVPGSFRIIGDCFLQGVMDGEAVGQYREEEIIIC